MRKRKRKNKSPRKRILILCEGETEEKYFRGIKYDEDYKRKFTAVNVDVYQPKNYSPLGLANAAIEEQKKAKKDKNPYNSIWIVFDRDNHNNVKKAYNIAFQKQGLNPCLSVICFEYWILLHFEKTTQGFRSDDEIIRYIEQNDYISPYGKTDNHFKRLKNKTPSAVGRSDNICKNIPPGTHPADTNAFTNVHQLVNYLMDL